MFAPEHFRESDPGRLWAAVERWSFGTVFSQSKDGEPQATLCPFIRREGRLYGHMARANPQWRSFSGAEAVLCQFQGPHAYISPAWYSEGGQIPTWNFVQVQVTGRPRLLDAEGNRWVVEETVREHELPREAPLGPETMAEQIPRILGGMQAFEIEKPRIEGSWKLSQNKDHGDWRGVVEALERGGDTQRELAQLMRDAHG